MSESKPKDAFSGVLWSTLESVFLAIVTIWLSDGNLFAASVSLFVKYLDHLAPMIVVRIKCMTRGKYRNYLRCQRHH